MGFIEVHKPSEKDIAGIVMSTVESECEGCGEWGPYVDYIRPMEPTYPNCPSCAESAADGSCRFQDVCYIETGREEVRRRGDPTHWKPIGSKTSGSVTLITSTKEAQDEFYPTPPSVADRMLAGIDWRRIETVLEPEAGAGDLVYQIAERYYASRSSYSKEVLDVDCCEFDPALREVCKYSFSEQKLADISREMEPLKNMYWREPSSMSQAQKLSLKSLEYELNARKSVDVHLVHDDFLSYKSFKKYDLIVMNPPFKNGAAHLLKALDMQKDGGSVCCLLNAQAIRNPYSEERQHLLRELTRLNADIQFIGPAFTAADAVRKTDADVVIIRVTIPEAKFDSDIYERMKKAAEPEYIPDPEIQALVPGDYIDQAIQMYQVETAATLELVRQYKALVPHMYTSLDDSDKLGKDPILHLTFGNMYGLNNGYQSAEFDVKKYMKIVRLKYWKALFSNEKFIGRLTSALRRKFTEQVSKMADYEFSAFNIKQVLVEMNASMTQGVEKAIMNLFDELTAEHSWYPECQQNRHYYNGWATNKAHKIGKKSIIPVNMYSYYRRSGEAFDADKAYEVISDLEKAFSYLNGEKDNDFDLRSRLKVAAETGETRNIRCKYFSVDLFKKGTMHIKYYPESMRLVERLNIYASRKKGWLPPNYGRAKYRDMEAEAKAVVDSFHGDGSDGSGVKAYEAVLAAADFYLAEPVQKMPALVSPSE